MTDLTLQLDDSIALIDNVNLSGSLLEYLLPIYQVFDIGQGETFLYTFLLKNLDNSLNLTGCSISTKYAMTHLYDIANVLPTVISNHIGGEITMTLDNTTTSLLKVGRYIYSTFLITPTGKRVKILGGILNIFDGHNQ